MSTNYVGVSHPCDECRVEVSFIIPTIDSSTKTSETLIDDKGNIEYWKTIRCEDCGTDSTHAGVYQAEWIDA
jgi:hypothetical protein